MKHFIVLQPTAEKKRFPRVTAVP